MSTAAKKRYTVAEYLALEESSDVKHEYFDGEIFAMAGGTAKHSGIAVNLTSELRTAVKEQGCQVYQSDLMVYCPTGLRTYPDASVVCDKPQFENQDKELVLLNPLVLAEVLSDTTEAYDRGKKFDHYQTIKSLKEYLLVSQDRAHVDHFTRQPSGEWVITKYDGLEAAVEVAALGCQIPMAEIYVGVMFEEEPNP